MHEISASVAGRTNNSGCAGHCCDARDCADGVLQQGERVAEAGDVDAKLGHELRGDLGPGDEQRLQHVGRGRLDKVAELLLLQLRRAPRVMHGELVHRPLVAQLSFASLAQHVQLCLLLDAGGLCTQADKLNVAVGLDQRALGIGLGLSLGLAAGLDRSGGGTQLVELDAGLLGFLLVDELLLLEQAARSLGVEARRVRRSLLHRPRADLNGHLHRAHEELLGLCLGRLNVLDVDVGDHQAVAREDQPVLAAKDSCADDAGRVLVEFLKASHRHAGADAAGQLAAGKANVVGHGEQALQALLVLLVVLKVVVDGEEDDQAGMVARLDGELVGDKVVAEHHGQTLEGVGLLGLACAEAEDVKVLVRAEHSQVGPKDHARHAFLVVVDLHGGHDGHAVGDDAAGVALCVALHGALEEGHLADRRVGQAAAVGKQLLQHGLQRLLPELLLGGEQVALRPHDGADVARGDVADIDALKLSQLEGLAAVNHDGADGRHVLCGPSQQPAVARLVLALRPGVGEGLERRQHQSLVLFQNVVGLDAVCKALARLEEEGGGAGDELAGAELIADAAVDDGGRVADDAELALAQHRPRDHALVLFGDVDEVGGGLVCGDEPLLADVAGDAKDVLVLAHGQQTQRPHLRQHGRQLHAHDLLLDVRQVGADGGDEPLLAGEARLAGAVSEGLQRLQTEGLALLDDLRRDDGDDGALRLGQVGERAGNLVLLPGNPLLPELVCKVAEGDEAEGMLRGHKRQRADAGG
eukprot:m.116287 g.116287  ORF g.116287 m.116287 type:complete len:754 (+) comp16069_c0_seq1:224-2485(+)